MWVIIRPIKSIVKKENQIMESATFYCEQLKENVHDLENSVMKMTAICEDQLFLNGLLLDLVNQLKAGVKA
jgi:hypothetical protein